MSDLKLHLVSCQVTADVMGCIGHIAGNIFRIPFLPSNHTCTHALTHTYAHARACARSGNYTRKTNIGELPTEAWPAWISQCMVWERPPDFLRNGLVVSFKAVVELLCISQLMWTGHCQWPFLARSVDREQKYPVRSRERWDAPYPPSTRGG